MDFPPVTMCDLVSARLMAACTIAIATVDYSCFATIADDFVSTIIGRYGGILHRRWATTSSPP
jgi:hypothetical protein